MVTTQNLIDAINQLSAAVKQLQQRVNLLEQKLQSGSKALNGVEQLDEDLDDWGSF
jgi:prefoldin subunit 5